jgi:hypothetical protein
MVITRGETSQQRDQGQTRLDNRIASLGLGIGRSAGRRAMNDRAAIAAGMTMRHSNPGQARQSGSTWSWRTQLCRPVQATLADARPCGNAANGLPRANQSNRTYTEFRKV